MTSTTKNSILLFLISAFLMLSTILKGGVEWPIYIALFVTLILVVSSMAKGVKFGGMFILISFFVIIFHYLTTSDKITTALLLFMTILLFEAVNKGKYSYKWILYLFIISFLVGLVFTFPSFLHGLTSSHSSILERYQGFFQNPNTYSAFCLMTMMCVILFMKPSKLRLLLLIVLVLNIYSTGSRNGILFIICSSCFYYVHKTKYAKYSFILFILFLLLSTYYLFYIEPTQTEIDIDVMGRAATSAGRSNQIIYVINTFPLKLFGNGKDLIDASVLTIGNFTVHNFYVNSLYALGVIPLLGYFYYVFHLWKTLPDIDAKSFLLAFNIYFFFEPGTCFYLLFLNVCPMIIIMLSKQKQTKITKPSVL